MRGKYTKQKDVNIEDDLKWLADDSNNTIQAMCQDDVGDLVQASDVIAEMPAFGTFTSKGQIITSFHYTAAKMSLKLTDEDIEQ